MCECRNEEKVSTKALHPAFRLMGYVVEAPKAYLERWECTKCKRPTFVAWCTRCVEDSFRGEDEEEAREWILEHAHGHV